MKIIKTLDLTKLKLETEPIERGKYERREGFLLRVLQRRNKITKKHKPVFISVDDLENPAYAELIYLKEKGRGKI